MDSSISLEHISEVQWRWDCDSCARGCYTIRVSQQQLMPSINMTTRLQRLAATQPGSRWRGQLIPLIAVGRRRQFVWANRVLATLNYSYQALCSGTQLLLDNMIHYSSIARFPPKVCFASRLKTQFNVSELISHFLFLWRQLSYYLKTITAKQIFFCYIIFN